MATNEVDAKLFDRVWEEAFENGELDVIDELVPGEYVLHTPGSPEPIRGSDAFKHYVSGYSEAFPDLSVTIDDRIVAEDAVVERFRMCGTHEGAFRGIPPTGNSIDVTGIIVHYMEGGKAVEDYSEFDSMDLTRQLGVVDPPGE